MKKFILFLACTLVAAVSYNLYSNTNETEPYLFPKNSTYEQEFAKSDSLLNIGQNRSALAIVKAIKEKAVTEKNSAQFVKSVLYTLNAESKFEEDSYIKAITDLETDCINAPFPANAILHSITSEVYWRYYQNNRWKFSSRTKTTNFENTDIRTWDLDKIAAQSTEHHLKSIYVSKDELKKINIDDYQLLLSNFYDSKSFRPTLYDFIANRAVDFFVSTETELTKPAYKFEINNADYFLPFTEFTKLNLQAKDSLAMKFFALKTYQELIAFHQADADPKALIDIDLKRLNFIYRNSVLPQKDSLYLLSLQKIENQFDNSPYGAEATFQIAELFYEQGSKYVAQEGDEIIVDENHPKWKIKKALAICDDVMNKFPKSDAYAMCNALKLKVLNKSVSITTEQTNVANQDFLAQVSYKNVSKIYFRIAKINYTRDNKLNNKYYGEELVKQYAKLTPEKAWSVDLPATNDFQNHKIELAMPALNYSYYVLLASNSPDFTVTAGNAVGHTTFWVSNISYFERRLEDGSAQIRIMDRTSGANLKGVKLQLWENKYNYTTRKYEDNSAGVLISNEEGICEIKANPNYRNFNLEFTNGNDRLYSSQTLYLNERNQNEKYYSYRTTFFTDRAIYRPGQTIYFKGLLLKTNGEQNELVTNTSTTVTFYDVNHQKVSSLDLTSNEYGTIQGSFVAPNGVLNGQMYITNGNGTQYFSVEEYKRPKFEVEFLPLTGSPKLNDSIAVKGFAKTYAGAVVDGAKVKYRVVRNAIFPYWKYYWRSAQPSSPEMEITNGFSVTNEKGEYTITFKALPDNGISATSKPTYSYTVYTDITDCNGETRSATKTIRVGYQALSLYVNIESEIIKQNEQKYSITTANLNGDFEPASGTIELFLLKETETVKRNKRWESSDQFSMTNDEYTTKFPFDIRSTKNENAIVKDKKIASYSFNTAKEKEILISELSKATAGKYVLEIKAKDKYNSLVENEFYFTLFDKANNKIAAQLPFYFNIVNRYAEPGEIVDIIVGSAYENVNALFEIEHKGKIIKKEFIALNKSQKLIQIPIEEQFRGNVSVHFSFVKHNRAYAQSEAIVVPYTNKMLDIEFETFRDKLLPGQTEEWKIKIKDKKGQKVAAELLASMYDASLDAFKANNWYFNIYNSYYSQANWNTSAHFATTTATFWGQSWNQNYYYNARTFYYLNWFGYNHYGYFNNYYKSESKVRSANAPSPSAKTGAKKATKNGGGESEEGASGMAMAEDIAEAMPMEQSIVREKNEEGKNEPSKPNKPNAEEVKVRTNLNETAFFYPQLQTDENGAIILKFTMPEALTKWKLMTFAHTKDLKYGSDNRYVVTQKKLMISPNAPRFFREGDKFTFTAKVDNLSDADVNGTAQLFLFDALTQKPIDVLFKNDKAQIAFTAKKGQSAGLTWNIEVPENIQAVTYRVIAKSAEHSDGEESVLPVLTNRMLVTETMPMPIRSNQTKTFSFEKLVNQSYGSSTLRNHKLTLEFTSNPAWYAIQALPYLMEYPYECAEQTYSRYYANSIASNIANSNPKIKDVFDSWKGSKDVLLSNLEKNQELKSVLLEETPWVLDSQNESERKKRVGLLFDLNKMSNELTRALTKLQKMQASNGGWPWFEGMPDNRYITQHIVSGFGKLNKLGVKSVREDAKTWDMLKDGVRYLDDRMREDYEWILKHDKQNIEKNHISYFQIQYLYARSFYMDVPVQKRNKESFDYYFGQAKKYWTSQGRYMQGMLAITLHRYEEKPTALLIMKALKENSVSSDEMGMYWKENYDGFYWYQAPIECQALMIEAFDEVTNDKKAVDDLRVWLLKSKQTQNWKTTKATAEACYALLLNGTDWLATDVNCTIKVGNEIVNPNDANEVKPEAGTGYFKTSWLANQIKPEMGNVTITKNGEGVSWGAMYWQYFEQLDKITTAKTPLQLTKKLFVERNTDKGPVIEPIDKTTIVVGDKIKVRIELRVDRDMEYVHMKDMRAAGFEPVNVLSGYKYQGGLAYYESTRDAATNFFIPYLRKGTYVFEYLLFVSHKGDFSNGITSIQCMYAPEFASHSEGVRVRVK
ncbi:MAG: alpha-2-macroglobulin family protein [Bacteroidota bacterium]